MKQELLKVTICALFVIAACGDEEEGPSTPPVEEWCDIDRPREDCTSELAVLVNNATVGEVQPICDTPCTRIKEVSFQGADLELLKALEGFKMIDAISINNSHESVTHLRFLSALEGSTAVELTRNQGLRSLEGLENLRRISPPAGIEPQSGVEIDISGNPQLRSVSALASLEESFDFFIENNARLEKIEGINALERAHIRINGNGALETIDGFDSMVDASGYALHIEGNPRLTSIDAFPNLQNIFRLLVRFNPNLDSCEAQRIVDQLAEPPEELTIEDNRAPCNR